MLTIGADGKATVYDDTYDITIHCESQEEQDKVRRLLENKPRVNIIYACDGKRCNVCNNACGIKLCEHTTEIEHARNFRKIRGSDVWCEEIPTTEWLGSESPYQCEKCGFHVDSKTRYCPDCGRRASNYGDKN